jgi:O-antigen ligase
MIWLLGGYMWLFIHRPFEVWPSLGTLQIERGYMLVTLLAWLVWPGKTFVQNRIHYAMVFFGLALAGTWFLSPYANTPGCTEVVENYFKVAVFYVLMITTVRDERSLRLLLLLYLGAVGLYMSHSLLEYFNGRIETRMGTNRMIGVDVTYRDPNAFAAAVLCALPMTLPFWVEQPRRVPRLLLGGFCGVALLCILLTGSRTGFLGILIVATMTVLLVTRHKTQALIILTFLGIGFFSLLSVALPQNLQDRYLTLIDPSRGPRNAQESAEGRLTGWLTGLELWQQSPLVGQGPGSYPVASESGFQAHNLYGQVLSEMGLLGAFGLLGMLLCFGLNWLETRRLKQQADELTALFEPESAGRPPGFAYLLSRSVALTILLMLLLGFAGHNLYRYHWQWFGAFQAIAVCCLRVRAEQASEMAGPAQPYLAWQHLPT